LPVIRCGQHFLTSKQAFAEHGGPAIASVADLRALYVTFSAGYGVTVIIFTSLYRHALHCASALELSAHERLHARLAIVRNLGFLTVAVTSLVLALTLPMSNDHPLLYALPGMAYVLTVISKTANRNTAMIRGVTPSPNQMISSGTSAASGIT